MDTVYQESLTKINAQLAQHPELQDVAKKLREGTELKNILEFEGVGVDILPTVEFETLLVIALYVPLSELSKNISESANIQNDVAKRIALMVETLILEPIAEALHVYDIEMKSGDDPIVPNANIEAKEKLELRPNVPPPTSAPAPVYGTPAPVATAPLRAVPPPAPLPTAHTAPRPITSQAAPPAQTRPLSREDLMNALGAKRTMAGDMERVRGAGAPTVPPPSQGSQNQNK